MKDKHLLVVIIFIMISNTVLVSIGSKQSLSPIIDTPEPTIYASVGQAFSLVYFVLDDDPWTYELQQDNSTLAQGTLETRRLEFVINYIPLGEYNYTLLVNDYSGNSANKTINVIVNQVSSVTSSMPVEVSSPGFEFFILGLAMIIYTTLQYHRKSKK
ncbi:MAG: hypothetical protein ACTSW1_11465 [Candidatus Hodarchaeales archaeon]